MPPAYRSPSRDSYDVVIIGGAVIGASVAYWLTRDPDFQGSVLVVERDPTYEYASTSLSLSGIRQQYSSEINVRIGQFGVDFLRGFADTMAPAFPGEVVPQIGFKENGYLYCVPPGGVAGARQRVDMQRRLGAATQFLDPEAIRGRFPYVQTDDIGGASWGARAEGWFDAVALMTGFRRAARQAGVEFLDNEVTGLVGAEQRIVSVQLSTGESVTCGDVVNAAGARAAGIAAMAGLDLPVEPRKRHVFVFAAAERIPDGMPLVIDPDGTYVRPEGGLFIAGNTPLDDGPADPDDFDTRHEEFEERIWPSLTVRIPAFEAIKLQRFWTGHYAYNRIDQNAIVGRHPEVRNFLFANGFSGHGLQQSPAVGRGVAELILQGGFRTLDLSPLGFERLATGSTLAEAAVI